MITPISVMTLKELQLLLENNSPHSLELYFNL